MLTEDFFRNANPRILITDSGLGGLAVCALLERKLHEKPVFRKADILFYNSQPVEDYGYNKMDTEEEKIRVFNNALSGMDIFRPDIILIACNTLSVLYDRTGYSSRVRIPVIGIVAFGSDMLYDRLIAHPDSTAIIFGTITTVAAGTHKKMLMGMGISEDRIVSQACPGLQSEIEKDADGKIVRNMIKAYINDAVAQTGGNESEILAGLCCTHFGYSSRLFENEFSIQEPGKKVSVIDPNHAMSSFIVDNCEKRFDMCETSVKVVSRTKLLCESIQSVANLMKPVSEKTAHALKNYRLNRELFDY